MSGPFSQAEIEMARNVPFKTVLEYLGAYVKLDKEYQPLDPDRRSIRLQIGFKQRDFRLVVTGEKFVNELLPIDATNRGGGGSIDLVKHLTGLGFVLAVRVCLDAAQTREVRT